MNILILSPHTDDESLGCGGSIYKWISQDHQVHVVCFSTCAESIPFNFAPEAEDRPVTEEEMAKASGILGFTFSIHETPVRHFPDHRQKILDTLHYYKALYKPDRVVGPSLHDIHQDHKTVAEEMVRCFFRSADIWSYDLPWNNPNFKPTHYEELDQWAIMSKFLAIAAYESQCAKKQGYMVAGDWALAEVRGADINVDYAEAFEVIRQRS